VTFATALQTRAAAFVRPRQRRFVVDLGRVIAAPIALKISSSLLRLPWPMKIVESAKSTIRAWSVFWSGGAYRACRRFG
jgi:hypothetical protein